MGSTSVEREAKDIVRDARLLLQRVVEHNAVAAYPQDIQMRKWMSGYYLNNARWRLQFACDALAKDGTEAARQRASAVQVSDFSKGHLRDWWDCLNQNLRELIELLEARLGA